MAGIRDFLRRHTLWLGFLAVLAPLILLLLLQFTWLGRLKDVSAKFHQASLHNYLEVVGKEVKYYYRSQAERALNLPASWFARGQIEKAAHQWKKIWKKKPPEGIQRLFLVDYTHSATGQYWVYDPVKHRLIKLSASDETLAMIIACVRWQMLAYQGIRVDSPGVTADEQNPDYRMLLNPITDDESHVVGVAGMILDEEFFKKDLLPAIIDDSLSQFFPERAVEDLVVTVRNGRGRIVLATRKLTDEQDDAAWAPMPFVFTDWSLWLHSPPSMPQQLAQENFATNVSLLALLAIALMGGIGLAFHAANRAMKLSEMKSDFVSNVSHELRTPLASIRVFAELLRLGRLRTPEKSQEYGEYIEAESRRLTGLINNILDFSRIESDQKTYRFVRGNVGDVVGVTLKTFEIRLKPSGFHIRYEGPERPLPPIAIDPDAIAQAIHNLLDNAVKYSGDSREIVVRLAHTADAITIAVRDHGIGIARSEQPKIFDRFHRVSTGLVHNVKGSGLGLAIVAHVVQAHHGRITVDSEPGNGSTFTIRLPLERASGTAPAGSQTAEAPDLGVQSGA
jgi:signal transduction histidine kinase